jgi:hypothetical protein
MRKMKWSLKSRQKMQSQRNDLKFEFPAGFEELTPAETNSIVAGESVGFWLGYVAGKVVSFFS